MKLSKTPERAVNTHNGVGSGLVVCFVACGSAVEMAGIRANDEILVVNKTEVKSPTDVWEALILADDPCIHVRFRQRMEVMAATVSI